MLARPRAQGPGPTNHRGFQFMAEWSKKDKAGYSYMLYNLDSSILGSLNEVGTRTVAGHQRPGVDL